MPTAGQAAFLATGAQLYKNKTKSLFLRRRIIRKDKTGGRRQSDCMHWGGVGGGLLTSVYLCRIIMQGFSEKITFGPRTDGREEAFL